MALLAPLISLGLGCIMIYWILKDRQRWDDFWEGQNRGRPLAPNWAGSSASKILSYILATLLFIGGFMGLCRFFHIF